MGDYVIAMPDFEPFKMRLDPLFRADRGILDIFGNNEIPEGETLGIMRQVVRLGDTVVDGGANIGFFSLALSTLVGPSGKVLSFEPGPENVERLRANVELNEFANVEIHEAALWDREDKIPFFQYAEDSGQNTVWKFVGASEPITVQAVCLASVTSGPVKLIKLDVEGCEELALEGTIGLRSEFIVCEMNEPALAQSGCSQKSLREHMLVRGYHTFGLHAQGLLPLLIPPSTRLEADYLNLNVLFASIESVSKYWPLVKASWKDMAK